jgi:peptidase M1-like protein
MKRVIRVLNVLIVLVTAVASMAQTQQGSVSRADQLRGEYGRYRSNNDLLYYHLDVRVDPAKKFVSGKTTVQFKMLADDTRIQLDLQQPFKVDKILLVNSNSKAKDSKAPPELKFERDSGAVFIDFPDTLKAGKTYQLDFFYSGHPVETGRFGDSRSVRIRLVARGSILLVRVRAPAFGGPTRTSGRTR